MILLRYENYDKVLWRPRVTCMYSTTVRRLQRNKEGHVNMKGHWNGMVMV